MLQTSFDYSIIGIVVAVTLAILAFSAIALYLAFRLRETFREEHQRGVRVAKAAFLIGILFLAGGLFYFFATGLRLPRPSSDSTDMEGEPPIVTEPEPQPSLSLQISYPSKTRKEEKIIFSYTIINHGKSSAPSVTIQFNELFSRFKIISSTHPIEGNVILVGDVPPGTTVGSLHLEAPEKPGELKDTITLSFPGMDQPITEEIKISIAGGP